MNDDMRIRYKSDTTHVNIDKSIFNLWEERLITTSQACFELEKSVGHPVSKSQFVINANWLGYHREK